MTLQPLFGAGPVVVAHAAAALAAVVIGAAQFLLPKGGLRHRLVGWAWVILMLVVSLSSFGISGLRQIGPFSWIHGLAVFTLVMLAVAVSHARARRIRQHRGAMIGLFAGALVIAGLFTLMPGRVMHAVLFQ